jgi:hypothetical protein
MAARIATRAQAQQLRDGILDALQKTLELAEAEIVGLKKREEAPPKTRLIPLKKAESSTCPKTGKAHMAGEFCKGCFKPIVKTETIAKNAAMGYGAEAGAPLPAAGAGAMEMAEGPMCPKCQSGSGEHLGAVGGKDVFMCRKCAHEYEGQPMAKAEGIVKPPTGSRSPAAIRGADPETVKTPKEPHKIAARQMLGKDDLEKDASREGLQLAGAKIPPKLPGAPKLKLPGLTAPAGTVARANQGLTGFKSLAGANPATPPAIKGSNYKSLAPHLGKSASCLMCKGEEHSGDCRP